MKKIKVKLILIITLNLFISTPLCTQFIIENLNTPLKKVYFPDSRNGFIFDGSIMYKTKNGGLNWGFPKICSALLSGYTSGKFFFQDSLYGWGSRGYTSIIKTVDGGNTWNEYLVDYVYITDLYFVNRNTGWAIANENQSPYLTVYKTVNSGLNWAGQSVTGYERRPMLSVYMRNVNTGWIGMDSGKIAKTTNSGVTWLVTNVNSTKKLSLINFANDNCGWVWLNPGQVLRTTNAGMNWVTYNMPYIYDNTISSYFKDSLNGWVTTGDTHLFKTTNGGQNWSAVDAGITAQISNVCFSSENTGWVVTTSDQIIRSTNAGLNWSTINNNTNDNFTSVFFHNVNTGWVVAANGAIYKTTNSGVNWNNNFYYGAGSMSKIFFRDLSTGWISSSGGYFFRTTNGGLNWSVISIANLPSNSMCFIDANTGWLAGNQGLLAKTSNSGVNWSFLTPVTSRNIKYIDFIDHNNGMICGDTGAVFKTTNAGNSWQQIHVADTLNFTSVKYYNGNDIYLAGYYYYEVYQPPGFYIPYTNKKLLRSSNNGATWLSVINHTVSGNFPGSAISVSPSTGGISFSAKDTYIRVTYDGGVSWSSNASPSLSSLLYNDIFMLDNQHIWAVGNSAAVVSSFTPVIGINQIGIEIPETFKLSQNYPNPFNPVTKIKFDISSVKSNSNVKLVIYDILGRIVNVLVNRQLSPGIYEADWDASNYSSGVYFYWIEAEELNGNKFVDSKKMVLLK